MYVSRDEFSRSDVGPDNTLTLRNVQRSHEDNYSCHAKNSLGTDEITYTLHIQGRSAQVKLLRPPLVNSQM